MISIELMGFEAAIVFVEQLTFSICQVGWIHTSHASCYDTAESSLVQQKSGGACAILGMTLSRMDLMFGLVFGVRSVQQRKVTPWVLSNSLKGLILRQEGEDRRERGMWIGLQYYEERTL